MTQLVGPSNPLAYALFHSRGGIRGHLIYTTITTVIVVLVLGLTAQYSGVSWRRDTAMWAQVLLILTPMIFGLAGMMNISSSVRFDLSSGMTDSLRLMRASPATVIAGYILGGLTQSFAICLPCIIGGAVASHLGGVGVGPFLWAMLLLMSSIGVFLVAAVYIGQVVKFTAMPVLLATVLIPLSAPIAAVSPPVTLLAGPFAGAGVLTLRTVNIDLRLILTILAHALLASLFFIAAMRRFRYPGEISFRADLGGALILLWSAFGAVGILFWDSFRSRVMLVGPLETSHAFGIIFPLTLLGLVPVIAASRVSGERILLAFHDHHDFTHAPGESSPPTVLRPLPPFARVDRVPWWAWPILVAVVGVSPTILLFRSDLILQASTLETIAVSIVCLGAFLLTVGAITRRLFSTSLSLPLKGFLIFVSITLLLLAAPILQWFILFAHNFEQNWNRVLHVVQFSPLGSIVMAWNSLENPTTPWEYRWGTAGQLLLCLVVVFLCQVRSTPKSIGRS